MPNARKRTTVLIAVFIVGSVVGKEHSSPGSSQSSPERSASHLKSVSVPQWLTDSSTVPVHRDRAFQKLCFLKESNFRRQADYVAQEIVDSMGGSLPPEETGDTLTKRHREQLNSRYAHLLAEQIEDWSTPRVRSEIRVEIVKRTAREKRRADRLAKIANEIAELEREAETTLLKERLSRVLKETGYVSIEGKVLPREEAYPPFGYVR